MELWTRTPAARQAETAAAQRAEEAQAELLALRSRLEEGRASGQAELDVLAEDADRLNARVLMLEQENQALRDRAVPAGGPADTVSGSADTANGVARNQEELA